MGCAGSKLDDLPAVAMCRDRTLLLSDAIRLRYALADAHAAYLHSLRAVGDSLHGFVDGRGLLPPPSPVLPLPTQRKGDPMPPLSPAASPPRAAAAASIASSAAPLHHHSHSDSGHLQFHSSGSDDEDDDDGPLHSGHSSPLQHLGDPAGMEYMAGGGGGGPMTYAYYAKKGPAAPAVSFEQPAMSSEVVQMGESSYYGYPYPRQDPNYYPNPYSYSYPIPYSSDGGMGGFFGAPSPQVAVPPPSVSPSSTKPPPPPPSPPQASTWEFLNPFESYNNYYPSYTPSRSSNAVREEEGIPDLEDEEGEVIKQAYGDQKFVAAASSAVNGEFYFSSKAAVDEDGSRSIGVGGDDGDGVQEANFVEKDVLTDEIQKRHPEEVVMRKVVPQSRAASDVVAEIKALFYKASESCDMVSRMLEVGKLPYHRRNYQVVSSKMRSAIAGPVSKSGVPSTSGEDEGPVYLAFNEEKAMKSGNLSSTLQKLYIWEKKLYEEVRAEEKTRVLHERKCRRLEHLDRRGAEAYKIASTQALVKKLSTKIKIAIQVVDSISSKIRTLRDEELWPQINELIQGFTKMWGTMMECHRSQSQAIMESRSLDAIVSGGKLNDAHMKATQQLELSLISWIDTFCSWFNAQKSFVKALNDWFFKCIFYEPEVTADGTVPFSPGRLGAPTVFVICNQWLQAMDSRPEREVVAAMQSFAASVLQLWDRHKRAERQRVMANDTDKLLKVQEKEEQVIYRAVDALNKKLVLVSDSSGIQLHQGHSFEANTLHEGLRQVFDAMERFAESSVKIYEGLLRRSEEEVSRESANVS